MPPYISQSQKCLKFTQTQLSPTSHVISTPNGGGSIQHDNSIIINENVERALDDYSFQQTVLCVNVTKESMTLVNEPGDIPTEIFNLRGSSPNSEVSKDLPTHLTFNPDDGVITIIDQFPAIAPGVPGSCIFCLTILAETKISNPYVKPLSASILTRTK